jgi:hypothetical protein
VDSCNPASGCVNAPITCDDGVACTEDACNPVSGCYSTPTTECSGFTDTEFCALPNDQFKLIYVADGTKDTSGNPQYVLNASNPGQFYYNVLAQGTPGDPVSLTIEIPYPFVTQGAYPIQVHDRTSFTSQDCFIPGPTLSGFTVTTRDDSILSTSGKPIIKLAHPAAGDYDTLELDATTVVSVTGTVPSTGLVYVTIHLDYGLKKSGGFTKDALTNAAKHPAFALADSALTIADGQVYNQFSYTDGGTQSGMDTPSSTNTFKKNPGFANMTLANLTQNPKAGVKVQIYGPTGKLLSTTVTDADGFAMFQYKHTGKPANYTVKLPDLNVQKVVTMKANEFAITVFDTLP